MKNLYIAIENKNRELNAKVLLACYAAREGFTSVIGLNNEIKHNLPKWKPGFVLWKGLARKGGATYKYFHSLGHLAIAWCEEGLVYPSSEFYQRYRVFKEALQEVDLFFAWGRNQANDIAEKVPEEMSKVKITGNPRIDILGKEYRAVFFDEMNMIRKKYSPFILINSNFSAYTHINGSEAVISSLKRAGRINTEEDEKFYRGRAENRKKVFNSFVEMLEALSSHFPDTTIVLRPHSAESLELWKERVNSLKNVKIIKQGSAMPWILASEVLIHNDCTTGLEAFLLDKPVVSFRPTAGNPYESQLPIKASKSIEKIGDLIAYVTEILKGDSAGKVNDPRDKRFIDMFIENHEKGNSAETIASILKDYANNLNRTGFWQEDFYLKYRRRLRYTMKKIYSWISGRDNEHGFRTKNKFSGLDVTEVENIINSFNSSGEAFRGISAMRVKGTETCIEIKRR